MDAFLAKLLLSGVVGGTLVGMCTIAGERFGSRIGGFVGGLPSVVMVIYFFIGWTQGLEQAHAATTSFPLTYAIMIFCVFAYVLQKSENLVFSILCFTGLWLTLQTIVVLGSPEKYHIALAIWGALLVVLLIYFRRNGSIIIAKGAGAPPRGMGVGMRIIIGSSIIMIAVFLSKMGGPTVGSVFAAFPGIFLSTLIIAHHNVGLKFSQSLLAPMTVSGMINCITYVAVFRVLLLDFGLVNATLAGAGAVTISAYVSRWLIDSYCFSTATPTKSGGSVRRDL